MLDNVNGEKIVGAIVIRVGDVRCRTAEFSFAHSDNHMGVGYMNTNDSEPTVRIACKNL